MVATEAETRYLFKYLDGTEPNKEKYFDSRMQPTDKVNYCVLQILQQIGRIKGIYGVTMGLLREGTQKWWFKICLIEGW